MSIDEKKLQRRESRTHITGRINGADHADVEFRSNRSAAAIERRLAFGVWLLSAMALAVFFVSNATAQQKQAADQKDLEDPGEKTKSEKFSFLRLTQDDEGEPRALEAAIARYVPATGEPKGLYVDLISAIHVADGSYYADLNKRFKSYDAVLYELVAPEGTRVPKGGVERDSLVSMLQGGMTGVLGLAFQLDEVDYTRKNLVHADMSPEEFSQSMKNRGETAVGIFFRMMAEGFAKQARDPTRSDDLRLIAAMFSANREHDLKVFMAEQFAELDSMMDVFGGKDGSTLVTERNKRALAVLRREIDKGQRQLAIFYGAGHMTDLGQRLEQDFGLRRESVIWIPAWALSNSR